jgi:hypothetical protein
MIRNGTIRELRESFRLKKSLTGLLVKVLEDFHFVFIDLPQLATTPQSLVEIFSFNKDETMVDKTLPQNVGNTANHAISTILRMAKVPHEVPGSLHLTSRRNVWNRHNPLQTLTDCTYCFDVIGFNPEEFPVSSAAG